MFDNNQDLSHRLFGPPLVRAWHIYRRTIEDLHLAGDHARKHPLTRDLFREWCREASFILSSLRSAEDCGDVHELFPKVTDEYESLLLRWIELSKTVEEIQHPWAYAVPLDEADGPDEMKRSWIAVRRMEQIARSPSEAAAANLLGRKLSERHRRLAYSLAAHLDAILLDAIHAAESSAEVHQLAQHCPQFNQEGKTTTWAKIREKKLSLWRAEAKKAATREAAEALIEIRPPDCDDEVSRLRKKFPER